MIDVLTERTLYAALGDGSGAWRLCVLQSCDSTNAEARRMLLRGESAPALIVAECQTSGRGRLGRQFYSPAGSGVYLSVLFPLSGALTSSVGVTCAASVAVMRAIRSTVGKQVEIKWVNDLYSDGKKVCGILTEAVSMGRQTHLIVGIGINLRPAVFPEDLAQKAGSLNDGRVRRSELIGAIVRALLPFLEHPDDRTWLDDYRAFSCIIGKRICWSAGEEQYTGVAEGIDEDGGLTVRGEDGSLIALRTGEISVWRASES